MERAVPVLPVDDLSPARGFYVDGLGFEVTFTLDCPMAGHGRDACVSLEVEDADWYYEEWRRRVEVKRPPRNEEWGARTFDVIDPFGNTIFVMGPVLP